MSTCYRHTDRETYINCSRCGNFICPDCMVSAPVGFQCSECVSQSVAPKLKTRLGAPAVAMPLVAKYILGICVGAYFYTVLNGGVLMVANQFGMIPLAIADGQWFRLLTAAFLHGSLLHLAFNMYALYWLGPQLESLLGHARFLALYLLAAFGGNVASYYFSDIATVSVGASGAIFGLMTATIVIGRELRRDVSQLIVLLGINVVFGFLNTGIDWRAHLGGAVIGALVAGLQIKGKRETQIIGLVGIAVALVALTIVRNQAIISAVIGN